MNNMDNHVPVEQLWYTWSDVGLSTIHAGFRIRAASPGLTEIYSDRVKSMERTMRYVLPPGTDRFAITPDQAPVGLTFIRSEWNNEYLLVHKKYTGADGVGRLGNFFIHALALGENSQSISTEDAIWLWESSLWQTDSKKLEEKDRRSTSLERLALPDVFNSVTHFRPEQFKGVQSALQFIIAAYLMRKDESTPLYIAAPARQAEKIAHIIAGLTNCLPAQLLRDLTFSTYEPDITKATTKIVGTSWITPEGAPDDATAIFPHNLYLTKLAVNCATREKSPLQGHPQIEYNQLAVDFAEFAAERLTTGDIAQLYTLRNDAETNPDLDVALFLQMYNTEIVNTESMHETEIVSYLKSKMPVNWLCRKNSRKKILDRAAENPLWGGKQLYELLVTLREQAEKESLTLAQHGRRIGTSSLSMESDQVTSVSSSEIRPRRGKNKSSAPTKKTSATLADALALLAKSAIPEAVKRMERASRSTGQSGERQKLVETITVLLNLMSASLLPQDPTEVWKQLLEAIVDSKQAINFLHSEWPIHRWLLKTWNSVLPLEGQDDDKMRPLLIISWDHLGEFLRLGMLDRHRLWIIFAIEELLPRERPTHPVVLELSQKYASEISNLLTISMQAKVFDIAANLMIRLVEQGYPIASGLQPYIEPLAGYLQRENKLHSAKELILALTHASYLGTAQYQDEVAEITKRVYTANMRDQDLINALIERDFPRRSWMIDLLLMSGGNQGDLLKIITHVYPTLEAQDRFFIQDGPRYLKDGSLPYFPRESWVQPMLALYQHLLPLSGRVDRLLFVLLDSISDAETIRSLLALKPLEGPDIERFLQRYGQQYLQSFQQTPKLASIIVTNFAQFVKSGHRNDLLFDIIPPQTGEQYLQQLLFTAKLTPEQQIKFLEQYGARYIWLYPTLPIWNEYINTYITSFHMDYLKNIETQAFFAFLTQNYKNLALDANTQGKIQCWKIFNNYLTNPDAKPSTLNDFAQALSLLPLPNNIEFKIKLAQTFVSCISTPQDLATIIEYMQVPKVAKERADTYQFLYILAEQAATLYQLKPSIGVFFPYLSYALTISIPEQDNRTTELFIHVFLDRLLYPIDIVSTSNELQLLNDFVKAQYDGSIPMASLACLSKRA